MKVIDNIKKNKRKRSKIKRKNLENNFLHKQEEIKNGELIDPTIDVQNLISEESFIPVKVKESSNCAYIEYESGGDTLFKTLSVIKYLDDIK